MRFGRTVGIARIVLVVIIVVVIAVAGAVSYLLVFPPKSAVAAPSSINIGSVLPLTGSGAPVGADEKIGLEFWASHVNQQGGLYMSAYGKNIPISLTVLDDGSDSSKDPALMQQLVSSDNVVAFVGGGQVPEAVAQVPVAERLHVPLITMFNAFNSTFNFWSAIDANPAYAFFVWPNFFSFSTLFFQWWSAQPASSRPMTIAAITPNIPIFVDTAQNFMQVAQAHGMQVVAPLQVYDVTATDLSSVVLKLKAAQPDMVFGMSLPTDGILFFKQAAQYNLTAKMFLLPPVVEFNQLSQALGSGVNGLVTTTFWNWHSTVNASQQLNTYYENITGSTATPITGCQAAGMQVLVNAIYRAGSVNSTLIDQALDTSNVNTVQGVVKFDSNHNSYTLAPILVQWQNMQQVIVYPPSLATSTLQYPAP